MFFKPLSGIFQLFLEVVALKGTIQLADAGISDDQDPHTETDNLFPIPCAPMII